MSRGWILKYRLRAESVQPEDDCGQILLLSANICRERQSQPLLRNACQKDESQQIHSATGKILIEYMENRLTARVVKHWIKLPRKAMESPSFEISKRI